MGTSVARANAESARAVPMRRHRRSLPMPAIMVTASLAEPLRLDGESFLEIEANLNEPQPPRRDLPGSDPLREPVGLGGRIVGDAVGGATAAAAYEAVFRAAPLALAFARDPHCRTVVRNAAMNRIVPASLDWHAWSLPDGSSPPLFEDGVPLPRERQPLRLAAFRGERSVGRELELRWPDREPVYLSVSAEPLHDADGRVCGAVCSAVDVGATRRAEHAAARRVERDHAGSRAQDEILGLLGHELRNPMNALATAVEVLDRADPAAPEATSARHIIGRQTRRLAQLVADVGDAGRAFADRREPVCRPLDLGELLRDCAARAGPKAEATGRRVACDVVAGVRLDADAPQLAAAVDRLLDEALRDAPAGATVAVRLRVVDTLDAVIEIGAPGDSAAAPSGSEAMRRLGASAGLALVRARHGVEAHGGRVDATRPDPAAGNVFVVRLPLAPRSIRAAAPGAGEAAS